MVTLEPVLQALGYCSKEQQLAFIKLLQASGAFGALPEVPGVLNNQQAEAILAGVIFDNQQKAAEWLHLVTQEHMLRRPKGVERHECVETPFFQQHRAELLQSLRSLGMMDDVKPSQPYYDHVLVLGAMEDAVNTRLDTLKPMWDAGVRFGKIHLLGSERPLDVKHEPMAQIAIDGGATFGTEMQMMMARLREKNALWPEGLQHVPVNEDVTTPAQAHGRANTADTINSWLEDLKKKGMPLKGRVLVISSQPNVAYQDAAVKSVLPPACAKPELFPSNSSTEAELRSGVGRPEFEVETVGARVADEHMKISVGMDAIARQIDVGFPKLLEALKEQTPVPPPKAVLLDPAHIKVDAATYQFRSGGDKNGVTQKRCSNPEVWDWQRDGVPVLVHRCLEPTPNGGMVEVDYMVNGHHRLAKGQRLNAQGVGPGKIPAIILGPEYSKLDAKIVGAYQNMAFDLVSGKADGMDIVDAALAFKQAESGAVNKALLPKIDLKNPKIRIAYDMKDLVPEGLAMVAKGEIPAEAAAEVANRLHGDHAKQKIALNVISTQLGAMYRQTPSHHAHLPPRNGPPEPNRLPGAEPAFLAGIKEARHAQAARVNGR